MVFTIMMRWILLAGVVGLGVAAIVVSQRRSVDVEASPAAVLYLVADTEQELSRMPVRFTRMSDSEEVRIGDDIVKMYTPSVADKEQGQKVEAIEKYLNQVGKKVAVDAHRVLPYRFHYVPNEYMINAFALPGGHVYVGGGLLALMDSEDELAAVLGHEIEHVDHYDCAERVQQEQALRRIPLGGLVAIPVYIFEAGYSKDQEIEADRDGTRLAVEAGYSPNGAIRMFEAIDRVYQKYRVAETHAGTPQEEVSQVAQQTLAGYFRSHPLPSERVAQVRKMIATQNWPARAERDLGIAYIFWTERAQLAMREHKYSEAEQLASRSVEMHVEQSDAWQLLAEARFAQAEFAEAANAYRKVLEDYPNRVDLVESYAMALAAADRTRAAQQFHHWLESVSGEKPRNAEAEQAGLNLLAGDSGLARKVENDWLENPQGWAPDYAGEVGWCYYLAGHYAHAAKILSDVFEQRPGDVRVGVRRAWGEIEVRHYSDAIQSATNGNLDPRFQSERNMVAAVAYWQAKEPDAALEDFERAEAALPEWRNPKWVRALYSPLVSQSIDEMRVERERRKTEKLAEKRRPGL